jgi:hypothetical protein
VRVAVVTTAGSGTTGADKTGCDREMAGRKRQTPARQARGRKTDMEAEVGNGAKSRTDRHRTKGPLPRFIDAMKNLRAPEGGPRE